MSTNTKLAEALRACMADIELWMETYKRQTGSLEVLDLAREALAAHDAEQAQQSERQRFEAWFSRDDEFDLNPAWGNRTREGKYTFPDVQEAWEAWQAAHASILARLEAVPMKDLDLVRGEVGTANFVGWNACRAAMLAAARGDTK